MHKLSSVFAALFLLLAVSCVDNRSLYERLEDLPQVTKVDTLKTSNFAEKYLVYFEQPIDHKNPSLGTFTQRVYVCNVDLDSATVVVTEGYAAHYAAYPRYREELSSMFNTNNVVIEHRYFSKSSPYPDAKTLEEVNWEYMNAEQAACDHHSVVTALKKIFKGKWIATGISKGGQTSGIYRAYFPDDVDITVPYVAPLCNSSYDERPARFIANETGTPEVRKKVKDFQIELLKRKKRIQPMFDSLCKARKYEFTLPLDQIYDYCVLEYSFSFWQWGYSGDKIPTAKASDRQIFNYLMRTCSPSYLIKVSDTSPFFIQAAKELGYYKYDLDQFGKYRKYFSIENADNYMDKLFLPESKEYVKFNSYIYDKLSSFLKTTDARMLYIYGGSDPWTAPRVSDDHKDNVKIFIRPGGSHSTRIYSFPEETRNEIKSILSGWLYE